MISRKPYTTEKAAYYGEKYHMLFDDIPVEYADMYEDIDIIVTNDSFLPSTFLNYDWLGDFNTRA